MATKQKAADRELDPECKWEENADNIVLRVHLSEQKIFSKEDFRVEVDGAGRLTVRGQRADAGGNIRLNKVIQLPPDTKLDEISGRLDAGVLSITVPKRTKKEKKADETKTTPQVQGEDEAKKAAAEQHKEEIINKKPEEEAAAEKIKDELEAKMKAAAEKIKDELEDKMKAAAEKIKDELEDKMKAAAEKIKEEAEAKRSKPDQEQKTAPPAVRKEEAKLKVDGPTKPSQQAADKVVDRESLLERVRRRAEEERAKAAAAAEEAERHRKQSAACGGWKERVAEELQGLKGSEWAEGVLETVNKNKEMIAAAVTAFSLGLFVASRLSSRN